MCIRDRAYLSEFGVIPVTSGLKRDARRSEATSDDVVADDQKTYGGATLVVCLRALLAGREGDLTGGETAIDG